MWWSVFNDHQRTMVLQTVLVMNIFSSLMLRPRMLTNSCPSNVLKEPQDPCIQSATELLLYGVGGLLLCLLATYAVVRIGLYQKMLFVKWLSIFMWYCVRSLFSNFV